MPSQVHQELTSRFYDTASASGPFSTSAIYSQAHVSELILAHQEAKNDKSGGKKKSKKKAPGPDELLQIDDGVKNREKKKRQQTILKEICDKFEAADIELPGY